MTVALPGRLLRWVAELIAIRPERPRVIPWGEQRTECGRGTNCPCYQRGHAAGTAEASAMLR